MSEANLPKIVVITDLSPLDTPDMITEAGAIKLTGDPDATAPPVADTAVHTEAANLQIIHNKRQLKPPTATAKEEQLQRDKVVAMYKKDARYVQDVANDVAEAAGDINAGIIVVQRIGVKLKKIGKVHSRHFEVIASGPGWVTLRVKSVGLKAAYIFRYGTSDKRGNPPVILGHPVINLEV